MNVDRSHNAADDRAALMRLWPEAGPTPLVDLPAAAQQCRVAMVFVKDESRRPLGSFKALGGVYAGLRALARAAGVASIDALLASRPARNELPKLICASDGNHGLAVATAAQFAGTQSQVFLHRNVPEVRARRIADRGAQIVWVTGTYDDAVDAACGAAARGAALLISDTSNDADDPVVADVMTGYGFMADEIVEQLADQNLPPPTHLFVQAGVGGLAAAMARGLNRSPTAPCRIVVVEPAVAGCVGLALQQGRIERIPGDLHTAAEMLSCGEASAPAVQILREHDATAIVVFENSLTAAPAKLAALGGPATTPSGATGFAGLVEAAGEPGFRDLMRLDANSRVLLIVSEGVPPG